MVIYCLWNVWINSFWSRSPNILFMINKLFTNKIFGIILLIVISFDLITSIMRLSQESKLISILVLRYVNLSLCLLALIFFFIFTKYSISILKLYIIFKLIMVSSYVILNDLKDLIIYSASRMSLENYIANIFSLLMGSVIYYFFRKYKIEN